MKNKLFIILSIVLLTSWISCSDDDDSMDGYTKLELEGGSLKCTTSSSKKETVKQKKGTVVVYTEEDMNGGLIYLKDEDGKYYWACGLSESYDGKKIIFSGTIYNPDPTTLTINPLNGLDFEITELWIKK